MHVTERVAGETAREYAFRVLRDNIVSIDLEPGSAVSENELAAALGISRTPIREAIIDLNKALIVEIYPQKGSYITLINPELVEESRFLREVLDTAVTALACEVATDEDIMHLEENLKLQEFYLANPVPDKLTEYDDAFHRMIFSIAKKERIYKMKGSMMIHYDRVRSLSLTAVKDIKIVSDHRAILEAIKKHDGEAAKAAVKKHLSHYKIDEEEKIREKYPTYFKQV